MKQYLFISALHVPFKYLGCLFKDLGNTISVSSGGLLVHRLIQITIHWCASPD